MPFALLNIGLVYLRATISGDLGPMEEDYDRLREEHGLPDPLDDQRAQLDELAAAMRRVSEHVYGSPA